MRAELAQINEAINMITHSLDTFGHDPELVVQLGNLLKEREELIKKIQSLN